MRRFMTLAAPLGLFAALLAAPVASASTTAPAIPPADNTPYAGGGSADLLRVDSAIPVGGLDLTDIALSPVSTGVDTTADPRSTASGANLDAVLLGALDLSDILSTATQSAPPDNAAPAESTLIPVEIPGVLDLGVSTSRASARWAGDGACLAPGEAIATGFNETAGADVLPIPGVGTIATVNNGIGGVSGTQSELTTAAVPGEQGRALVSTSETQIDNVTLFQGTDLELGIGVAATPTLTATASGQPGGAGVTYSDPLVTIDAPDGGVFEGLELLGDTLNTVIEDVVLGDLLDALNINILDPLADTGLVNLEILVGEETLNTTAATDGTGAAGTVSVVQVRLSVLELLGADPLVDLLVDVGPMFASVAVPAGGINCHVPECSDGADNDDDGFTDADDPNCHTDGNPYNPDSYDPNDDDESGDIPECVDRIDNDGDAVSDMDDPGCHTDGDPTNPDSFDPTDDDESEAGAPPAPDPGPMPRTGGDIPLAAAMAISGLGLAALQLMRRRRLV